MLPMLEPVARQRLGQRVLLLFAGQLAEEGVGPGFGGEDLGGFPVVRF